MTKNRFLPSLFLVTVFLLAFNKIKDTDAWIHLSHGRLIWELKGLPGSEPFIYTIADAPYFYTSWLFGVLSYLTHSLFSAPGLVVFQAAVVTAAFHFLYRDAVLREGSVPAALLLLPWAVMIGQYRFLLRPDIFMMLFLAVTVYWLRAWVHCNRKYLYFLPLLHLLWANTHSSIPLMVFPYAAFIVGGLADHYLLRPRGFTSPGIDLRRGATIAGLFCVSLAASLLNPYGIRQYFTGSGLMGSSFVKQEIIELLPPNRTETTILIVVVALVVLSFLLAGRRFSFVDLLLVLPFFYVASTARRFVFLAAFVGTPILVRNFSLFLAERGWGARMPQRLTAACTAGWLVLYPLVTMAKLLPFETHEPGAGFSHDLVPKEAVAYLDANRIGGRTFNSPTFGQYIIWSSYPSRTVNVDARFHLPDELLQKFDDALHSNAVLDELSARYGFDVIIEQSAQIKSSGVTLDSSLRFQHPQWALVYWDDKAMVYLKRKKEFETVIARDEYRHAKPWMTVAGFDKSIRSGVPLQDLLPELERNARQTGSSLARLYLGLAYAAIGNHETSLRHFLEIRRDFGWIRSYFIGQGCRNTGRVQESLSHFEAAVEAGGGVPALLGLGTSWYLLQRNDRAVKPLEKALALDRDNEQATMLLAQVYRALGRTAEADAMARRLNTLRGDSGRRKLFADGVEFYLKGDYQRAIAAFQELLKLERNVNVLSNLGYCYYDLGRLEEARRYFEEAIAADPGSGLPYYGVALVHRKLGNHLQARLNFQKYVDLNPRGKYAREALAALKALPKGPQ